MRSQRAKGDAELFCEQVVLGGERPGCEQLVSAAMADPESDLSSEEEITVLGIEVRGDTAEVRIEDDGGRTDATFVETDMGWRFRVSD
jgi:hypothetical protein